MTLKGKLTSRKLVRSPWLADQPPSITHFSPCDQTSIAIATARATFIPGNLDFKAFEECLVLCLEDLPFLAGRLLPIKSFISWKMGDLSVVNTNAGAELALVDARPSTLADCGPDTWPMQDVTISNPRVPFYIPSMDVGAPLLKGKEPLCKVQVTQLADGCILGITLSHTLTDGMHWPALICHIAARYRQVTTGRPAPAEALLAPPSRPEALSLSQLQLKLPGGADWEPEPFSIQPCFSDYLRAAELLWGNAATKIQSTIIFLPKTRLASLKADVATAGLLHSSTTITTGDIVQALGALAVHAAEGRSLLPIRPQCMIALIQVPGAAENYWGNAVHPLTVGVEEETPQPDKNDMLGVLSCLATHIRLAVSEIRSDPAKALQAVYESQQVCDAPVGKSLAYLAGQRFPFVTCTTNFIGNMPQDQKVDFGTGFQPPIGYRSLTYPLARGMAVIRPSMPPYADGLFLSLSLSASQLKALKQHPLLPALVPDARFLGTRELARDLPLPQ